MTWDDVKSDGEIYYASDHNGAITEIKKKALLVGGTLDGNVLSGSTPVLFDVTPSTGAGPTPIGSIYWNTDDATARIQLDADTDLPIGLRELRRVYNPSGVTMTKGSVVYTTGVGGTPTIVSVALAKADAASTSLVLGILAEDILAAESGFCTVRGHVYYDTSGFDGAAGDTCYLSPTVAGGITSVKPSAPDLEIRIGRMIIKDAAGKQNVRVTQIYSLDALSDVSVPSPVANQLLKFDGVSWVAADSSTVSSAGGTDLFPTGDHAIPIEGMTAAATCEVTMTGHGQATGAAVFFYGITQANWTVLNSTALLPKKYVMTVTGNDTFTIPVNSSAFGAYNAGVDPGTYVTGKLASAPDTTITTQTDSAQSTGSVEVLMSEFVTPAVLGRTDITGGEWTFKTWCYASSATNTNTVVIRVFKMNTAGTQTELFNAETADLGVVNTLSQITTVQPAYTVLATDRLVISYFAKSDRGSGDYRTLYLTHNGTTQYSFVKTPISLGHASLGQLTYATAGHTGFAPSNPLATDSLFTAAGEMVIGTGSATAHKLAAGANTTILKGNGAADPVWSSDIPTAVTIGSAYIYRAGGTDVPVADGGLGISTAPSDGMLPIGNGTNYTAAVLTEGATTKLGVDITNAAGAITIGLKKAYRTIFLSLAGGWTGTTNPDGGFVTVETNAGATATSFNIKGTLFDATAAGDDRTHEFTAPMPDNWDGSTVTAIPYCVPKSAATAGHTLVFGLRGAVFYGTSTTGDLITDMTFGTAATAEFVLTTDCAGRLHKGPAAGPITLSGATPAGGALVQWKTHRMGTDTYVGGATLLGWMIKYGTNKYSDD